MHVLRGWSAHIGVTWPEISHTSYVFLAACDSLPIRERYRLSNRNMPFGSRKFKRGGYYWGCIISNTCISRSAEPEQL